MHGKIKQAIIILMLLFTLISYGYTFSHAGPVMDFFSSLSGRSKDSITCETGSKNRLRVMTYNIQGYGDGGISPEGLKALFFKNNELVKAIKKEKADILFLNEAIGRPSFYITIFPDQVSSIAGGAGYKYYVYQGNASYAGGLARLGNAILSRTPLYDVRKVTLPAGPGGDEPRGLLAAKTRIGNREVVLIAVHLSRIRFEEARRKQIEFIASFIKQNYAGKPVILGGDFNTEAGHPLLSPVTSFMKETFLEYAEKNCIPRGRGATIDSRNPKYKFDHLYITPAHFKIIEATVPGTTVSDHRPFRTDLSFK